MTIPATLHKHVGYGNSVILSPGDDDDMPLADIPHGEDSTRAEALADEIIDRYNAPLIILGRSLVIHVSGKEQYHVIHEGERKLMTMAEITDVTYATEFVDE